MLDSPNLKTLWPLDAILLGQDETRLENGVQFLADEFYQASIDLLVLEVLRFGEEDVLICRHQIEELILVESAADLGIGLEPSSVVPHLPPLLRVGQARLRDEVQHHKLALREQQLLHSRYLRQLNYHIIHIQVLPHLLYPSRYRQIHY